MSNDRHFLIDPVENANAPAIVAGRRGNVITIDVSDAQIGEVIEAGYDRLLVERSTDAGLSWRELTAPSQRPVLEPTKIDYRTIDRAGDPAFLYRTRYIDTRNGDLSEASEDIAGEGLALRGLLSVKELKRRYLFGVDTSNDLGEQLGDDVYQHYILAAIRSIEHELDVPILPTSFVEFHDYYRSDYEAFALLQLDNYPLISVEEYRVQYPSGQAVITFPPEWLRINAEHGQVQIVPTAGTLSNMIVGQGGSFLPAIYAGQDYLPQLFQITYTAGFGAGRVPRDIIEIIGMLASMGPFNIFGDLIAGAGIANLSLSMDGLSQNISTTASATNAGYGSRIIQYTKQIKEKLPMLRRYYKGIRAVFG